MDVLKLPDVSRICRGRVIRVSTRINVTGRYIAIRRGILSTPGVAEVPTPNLLGKLAPGIVRRGGARKAHLIFARREAGFALEQLAECAGVAVTHALADHVNADGPRFQQPFGHFDTQILKICHWREAHCLLET